ncbi:hypothetical protein MCUN1_002597 [Malassezia cuniculi]|uniref:Elongation factor 2 n=1 Tax=Malassezia cuniculi TaxID=948313 RepID=A0AAF0ES57_9BASI|nr:hypothetical protein MCUN1_002597 [Malassezia cuniculi]
MPVIRNVGIVAHIDAGKTTLTERLLRLSNTSFESKTSEAPRAPPGDVDSGTTVTDFLEEERERGITIQSAAVGPVWWTSDTIKPELERRKQPHSIATTFVDTPGHVDFGFEVERSVRVVDGSVVVLDGVEGVEPQTANVWRQASRYDVKANVIFVNKMDRTGSSLARTVRSVHHSLHKRPVVLQLPVKMSQIAAAAGGKSSAVDNDPLVGLVDVARMKLLRFEGVAGENCVDEPLTEKYADLYHEAKKARAALVDVVSAYDEELMMEIIENEGQDGDAFAPGALQDAIRRLTLDGQIVPVLCGSAAKNIGVQPLLDAIALYLPSPADKPPVSGTVGAGEPVSLPTASPTLSVLAFKVVWDPRRGPVTFVRVYSGRVNRKTTLYNTATGQKERATRILFPFADQYNDVPELLGGQVGVILGLQNTRTGDTLIDAHVLRTEKKYASLRLRPVHVPPPVFSVSVEPQSKSDEGPVLEALRMLIRTDPSLRFDEGSSATASGASQMVLSGMGELHLEIAQHRLEQEFKVNAHFGHVRVGFRETITDGSEGDAEVLFDREIGGKRAKIGLKVAVRALDADAVPSDPHLGGNDLALAVPDDSDFTFDNGMSLAHVLRQGVAAAVSRGPLSGYPLAGLHITLEANQTFGPELCTPAAVRLAVSEALRTALGYPRGAQASGITTLMEPMMHVRIEAPETSAGRVSSDICSEQAGSIDEMVPASEETAHGECDVYVPPDDEHEAAAQDDAKIYITARIPLSRMMRYSTRLRALTGGVGTYTMSFDGFAPVQPDREREILEELGRIPRR